ncbi:hypothetical protein VL20_2496 [Microcystis panniformis FACHB-1757]|uniref:Uncharacterized protein n=1 Tax=Microcystis panniformis FACHB-1757 TaxID=1638788 RepID=A0A0K1S0T2_9CHRO|nr:hypothetical protein VL20_2496 [Microcystis panniformis FACHB-1757]
MFGGANFGIGTDSYLLKTEYRDIIRVCRILNHLLRIDAIEIWFFIFVKYGPTREDEPWKIKIC